MNAITHDTIYSLFPRLTYANEGLVVERDEPTDIEEARKHAGGGVELYRDNSHWTRPCGHYCPMMNKKTYDDDGVARYRWSPWQDDLTVVNDFGNAVHDGPGRSAVVERDLMYSDLYSWRVLDRCTNSLCDHAQKSSRRGMFLNL